MQTAVYILAGAALIAVGAIGGLWFGFHSGVEHAIDLLKRSFDELMKKMENDK